MNLALFSDSTHLTYITRISSMDATNYWPFAREYSIWNATVAALQFWMEDLKTSHPQWCYRKSLHSLLLQQLCKSVKKHIRRSTTWSLYDHLKWGFWMKTCTRRWRISEWEWKLEYSHSPTKSTMPISHLSKWKLVFQSCYTTYQSASTSSTVTSKTQQPQSCTLPSDIWQFWWREPFNR